MSIRMARRVGSVWALCWLAIANLPSAGCERASASQRTELSVFAASSLTEAFRELEASFEQADPNVDLVLTLAGSQVLRLQIENGARADLFASANEEHLDALAQAGVVGERYEFARNDLVLIVPEDNPAKIASFEDLRRARRIVIGAPNVPIGKYTRELFRRAATRPGSMSFDAIRSQIVSEESNVRLVRAKVALGEADAAVVYRTDAEGVRGVRVVPIAANVNVQVRYPIGVVRSSAQPSLVHRFIAHIRSPSGQAVLRRHGFMGRS